MKTNSFIYALLWLSKTDPMLYHQSPQNVKWSRTNLGVFVLLTGVFAFVTASFFIRSLFIENDSLTNQISIPFIGWLVSVIFGLFWAIFIIAMDREIISSNSKWGPVIRIVFALGIGFIISLPLKVMIFQNPIFKELTQASRLENAPYEGRYLNEKDRLTGQIQNLEEKISEHRSEMARFADLKHAEEVGMVVKGATGLPGEGDGFRTANENILLHEKLVADYTNQLEAAKQSLDKNLTENQREFQSNRINQSFDFPTQYKALDDILARPENLSWNWFAVFLMIIFMVVEAMPAFMKIIREKDEYDALLSARTVVNQQLINVVTNDAIGAIQNSPTAFVNPGSTYSPAQVMKTIGKNLN
jgi:hypothetical protein